MVKMYLFTLLSFFSGLFVGWVSFNSSGQSSELEKSTSNFIQSINEVETHSLVPNRQLNSTIENASIVELRNANDSLRKTVDRYRSIFNYLKEPSADEFGRGYMPQFNLGRDFSVDNRLATDFFNLNQVQIASLEEAGLNALMALKSLELETAKIVDQNESKIVYSINYDPEKVDSIASNYIDAIREIITAEERFVLERKIAGAFLGFEGNVLLSYELENDSRQRITLLSVNESGDVTGTRVMSSGFGDSRETNSRFSHLFEVKEVDN
jgi:hypothetical protein